MSLYRQLWIGIALLMLVVFSVTFLINGASSSRYLAQQLTIKNADDATALALSLSQQSLDEVGLELQLSAQFDLGSYERLELVGPDGTAVFSRSRSSTEEPAPGWLKSLFPIESSSGSAEITDGFRRLGTLTLKSHDDFAYDELWTLGKRTFLALLIAVLLAGALGTALLRVVLTPLTGVVAQATALSERRFEQQPVPPTREFAVVTEAMNTLTARLEAMLSSDAKRLAEILDREDHDSITGLLAREAFMRRLHALLEREGEDSEGSIALVRVGGLATLNQEFGRAAIDEALAQIGRSLGAWTEGDETIVCGRVNGSDFICLAPRIDDAEGIGAQLRKRIASVFDRSEIPVSEGFSASCSPYGHQDTFSDLLRRLDQTMAMDSGDVQAPVPVAIVPDKPELSLKDRSEQWSRRLDEAMQTETLHLELYPVLTREGDLFHREGMLRLEEGGERFTGAAILPWAHRLGRTGDIDRSVVRIALALCRDSQDPVCISLSARALGDPPFQTWLSDELAAAGNDARRLHVEIEESAAFDHVAGFEGIRQALHEVGALLGIEHMGYRIADLGLIASLGADYLKVDSQFVRDIDGNTPRQALLSTYASIARQMGIACVAEGVRSAQERQAAIDCGVSGVSGPGVTLS